MKKNLLYSYLIIAQIKGRYYLYSLNLIYKKEKTISINLKLIMIKINPYLNMKKI